MGAPAAPIYQRLGLPEQGCWGAPRYDARQRGPPEHIEPIREVFGDRVMSASPLIYGWSMGAQAA